MEPQNTWIWEVTAWEFVFVTIILGGGAAFLTGRVIARGWQENWLLAWYMVLLCLAVRFIHFSLFGGTLLSPYYYLVDLVVLIAFAFAGKRMMRARQMARQYSFKYDPSGPFSWRRKAG